MVFLSFSDKPISKLPTPPWWKRASLKTVQGGSRTCAKRPFWSPQKLRSDFWMFIPKKYVDFKGFDFFGSPSITHWCEASKLYTVYRYQHHCKPLPWAETRSVCICLFKAVAWNSSITFSWSNIFSNLISRKHRLAWRGCSGLETTTEKSRAI